VSERFLRQNMISNIFHSRERRPRREPPSIEHIEAHLSDPALKPATVAAALRISPRYLHRLFAAEAETVERYILRRRLEDCADQLGGVSHDRRHVSEIAVAGGFSTLAHFCRTFRARYGMSPGEYREYARRRMGGYNCAHRRPRLRGEAFPFTRPIR
jgi:AraC-like DNA-binding protein